VSKLLKIIKLLLISFIGLFCITGCNFLKPEAKQIKEERQMLSTNNIKVFYKVSERTLFPEVQMVQLQTILHDFSSQNTHIIIEEKISKRKIAKIAKSKLGKKYEWGGNGPYAYDCSGFTKEVFKRNGITLPRVSIKQAEVGKKIKRVKSLKKGDLVFFTSRNHHKVDHVGIYLGHGKFIHASNFHHKIVISPLREYKRYFKWGRRFT